MILQRQNSRADLLPYRFSDLPAALRQTQFFIRFTKTQETSFIYSDTSTSDESQLKESFTLRKSGLFASIGRGTDAKIASVTL